MKKFIITIIVSVMISLFFLANDAYASYTNTTDYNVTLYAAFNETTVRSIEINGNGNAVEYFISRNSISRSFSSYDVTLPELHSLNLNRNDIKHFQITLYPGATVTSVKLYPQENYQGTARTITTFIVEDPDLPNTTTDLSANAGDGEVVLSWSSVDNATAYNVYRDDDLIHTTTSTNYTDTDVTNSVTYSYQVSAVNEEGESDKSAAVQATPTAEPLPPLPPPNNLAAAGGKGDVTLTWDDVPGAIGYNVYVDGVKSNVSPITATTYIIKGLDHEQDYQFYVTTLNAGNQESVPSAVVIASPSEPSTEIIFSDLPFTVMGMLSTALGFLAMYGQWILLALGVIFAPVLYNIAVRLIDRIRGQKDGKFGRREWLERERSRREYWESDKGKKEIDRVYRQAGFSQADRARLEREDREQRMHRSAAATTNFSSDRAARDDRPGRPGRQGRGIIK
jgi:hypothetical protein